MYVGTDVSGDFCTKRNGRESTWTKSRSCPSRGLDFYDLLIEKLIDPVSSSDFDGDDGRVIAGGGRRIVDLPTSPAFSTIRSSAARILRCRLAKSPKSWACLYMLLRSTYPTYQCTFCTTTSAIRILE